ncbi:MAG TPA: hypothetical protein VIM51_08120 [Desulfosporosinus sp.]
MMKRIMMKRPKMMKAKSKKRSGLGTAIATLLSATAAFAAFKVVKKIRTANANSKVKSEFEIVMDSLVEDGTITQVQQDAIQSALTIAKEARIAKDDLEREENGEVETVLEPTKINPLTRIRKSVFSVGSEQEPKPAEEISN